MSAPAATTALRIMLFRARPAPTVVQAKQCAPNVTLVITVLKELLFQLSVQEATIHLLALHNVLCVQRVTFAPKVRQSRLGVLQAVMLQKAPTFAFNVQLEITVLKALRCQLHALQALTAWQDNQSAQIVQEATRVQRASQFPQNAQKVLTVKLGFLIVVYVKQVIFVRQVLQFNHPVLPQPTAMRNNQSVWRV